MQEIKNQESKKEEIFYIAVDENFVCGEIFAEDHSDAIDQFKRQALGWYQEMENESSESEYICQSIPFSNSCLLAVPEHMLTAPKKSMSSELITDLVVNGHVMEISEFVEEYAIFSPSVLHPEEPEYMTDSEDQPHKHRWVTLSPAAGSGGGGVKHSNQCSMAGCYLVEEYDSWNINRSNGLDYEWFGYREMNDDQKKRHDERFTVCEENPKDCGGVGN